MNPPSMLYVILHLSCWLNITICALPSIQSTETIELEQRNSLSVLIAGNICEKSGRSSPNLSPSCSTARQWKCLCCSSVLVVWKRWTKLRPQCSALTSTDPCCSWGEMVAGDVFASMMSHSYREGAIFWELMRRRVPGLSERASWKLWAEWEELARSCVDCPSTATNSTSVVISLFIFKIQCSFSPVSPAYPFPAPPRHFAPFSTPPSQPRGRCKKIALQ